MKNLFKSKFILIFILISLLNFAPSVHAQDILDITEFPAVGGLYGITNGNDGNIWITATSGVSEIWKFTSDGISTVFPVPTTLNYSALGPGITSGPDGNIWFTESETNKIGKITPNGTITEYSIPTNNSKPMYITTDSNGNLWFTEQSGNKIGKITISGIITEFSLPTPGEAPWGNTPTGITDGHDGNIWFTEYGANKIGRITPNGSITEFPIPNNAHNNPWVIISGSDGNLWFTEGDTEANKIGRITTEGVITEFSIPTSNSRPHGITTGNDGNFWFTEFLGQKIGRITPNGTISEFSIPNRPLSITSGSDDNIWFTEETNKIGRINLSAPTLTPTSTPTPNPALPVPYFSQNDSPWGSSEYDHSQSLGFSDPTMNRWGCAVTSTAMVLKYHGMNQMINGTPLDPESVNEWLKNNNGYATGSGSDGSYSYINWPAIGKLSKDLFVAGKSSVKLEHHRSYPNDSTTDLLNHDLTVGNDVGKFPDILLVKNAITDGHFVVAKGILNNTYAINDPEWNYSDLSAFNNSYLQVDRYVPSHTDLSYVTVVINPNVEILVTDPQGRKTGKYIHDGITQIYNDIPNATYGFEGPISNPNATGHSENLGTGVHSFLLPKVTNGDYTITLSSNKNTTYTVNTTVYTLDGDNKTLKTEGTIVPNIDSSFAVSYDKQSLTNSTVKPDITLQKLKTDLQNLYNQKLITNYVTFKSLETKVSLAIQFNYITIPLIGKKLVINTLQTFLAELNTKKGIFVKEDAYQILSSEATFLIKNFQN